MFADTLSPQDDQNHAALMAAHARVEDAMANGGQAQIDEANAAFRALMAPATNAPEVIHLPATRAHKPQQFTGAPRRVTLTGGRVYHDGGAHRHQRLYR